MAEATETKTSEVKWEVLPVERNYFRESQQTAVRNFVSCDSREHPLALVTIQEIQSASKFASVSTLSQPQKSKITEKKEDIDDDDDFDMDTLTNADDIDKSNNKTKPSNILDPLRSSAIDPLSNDGMLEGGTSADIYSSDDATKTKAAQMDNFKEFIGWKNKRAAILKKYTTSKRIGVTANFLEDLSAQENEEEMSEQNQLKKRVEELEISNKDAENSALFMSQTEYIKRMENNVKRLRKAWHDGKRVLSLKIAIQCSKMLGNQAVMTCPQFYPSMYVLIADVLDSFGDLVFDRLKAKANNEADTSTSKTGSKLRENFTYLDVNPDAKETCLNWFYKIACIRELMPRLFIELSLFKNWRFIRPVEDYSKILKRCSRIIRGIGDPLVAAYARAYLIHRGFEVCGDQMRSVLLESFDDFLFVFNEIDKHQFKNIPVVVKGKITEAEYIDLYSPCLDWVVQCIGYKATEEEFFALLQRYKDGWNNSIILLHILSQFNDVYISKHSKLISRLIKESFVTTSARSKLYRELGLSIVSVAPPQKERLPLLNEIWKVVSKINAADEYVMVASVYIEYILQHFSKKEIDILLSDVINHLKKDLAFQSLQDEIYTIVSHILKYVKDFKDLFSIHNFLPLIDMLESGAKMSACKLILESFRRNCDHGVSDAVLISSLLDVSRMLHDSIDHLTFEDERRQITDLICHFVDCIDYGHDLERQLNEYIECRAIFSNLDGVIYLLVTKVGNLAMKAHQFMHGNHNKKTAAFVKACLAYCHITIPSLEDYWSRMYLFANMGAVALTNQMIIQSEAFLKAAITLIPILPQTFTAQNTNTVQSTASLLAEYVHNLASLLLLLPGHPDHGPFYLLVELWDSLKQWGPWSEQHATPDKIRAYIALFKIFATAAQRKFPYKIKGVASNDELFGQSSKFLKHIRKQMTVLGGQIIGLLEKLSESPKKMDLQMCGFVALEFMNVIVDFVQINDSTIQTVVKLHSIAINSPNLNQSFLNNTIAHIDKRYPKISAQLNSQTKK